MSITIDFALVQYTHGNKMTHLHAHCGILFMINRCITQTKLGLQCIALQCIHVRFVKFPPWLDFIRTNKDAVIYIQGSYRQRVQNYRQIFKA